jgi:hypothetical protein
MKIDRHFASADGYKLAGPTLVLARIIVALLGGIQHSHTIIRLDGPPITSLHKIERERTS